MAGKRPRRIAEPAPFEAARAWARSLGLRTNKEWRAYPLSKFPPGIPKNPDHFYGSEWTSWGDWLGSGRIAERDKIFRSYDAARLWVQESGICSEVEWRRAVEAGRIPDDIPSSPRLTYRKEWTSSGDFYGTGFVAYSRRKWRTMRQAQRWADNNHIHCADDWRAASKAGLMPPDVPADPRRVYAKEFKGWAEFFGNSVRGGSSFTEAVIAKELAQFVRVDDSIKTIRLPGGRSKRVDILLPKEKIALEYDGARWHQETTAKDVAEIELFRQAGWRLVRIRESPLGKLSDDDVVVSPKQGLHRRVVAILEHLLAIGVLSKTKRRQVERYRQQRRLRVSRIDLAHTAGWMSFAAARRWARSLRLASTTEYRRYVRKHGLPKGVPSAPEAVYEADWINWGDFLGTSNPYWGPKNWRSFEQARQWVKDSGIKDYQSWNREVKAGRIPEDIPRRPHTVYRGEWVSYPHWFGFDVKKGQRRQWREFEAARAWARASGATCDREWRLLAKEGRVPRDIPTNPGKVYREWKGLGDWLGTGRLGNRR